MTVVPPRPWVGEPTGSCVVFGVLPGQDPAVIATAARLTARMGASLVFVWADGTHVEVERHPDGTVITTPLDPDQFDDPDEPLYVYADPAGHPFCIFVVGPDHYR